MDANPLDNERRQIEMDYTLSLLYQRFLFQLNGLNQPITLQEHNVPSEANILACVVNLCIHLEI